MKAFYSFIGIGIGLFLTIQMNSQSSRLNQNEDINHIVDRFEILYGGERFSHSASKDLYRADLVKFLSTKNINNKLSILDEADLEYVLKDNIDYLKYGDVIEKKDNIKELYQKEYIDSIPPFYTIKDLSDGPSDGRGTTGYDNPKPLFGSLYLSHATFWEISSEDFYMKLNPVVNFQVGMTPNDDNLVFQNTRGFEIRGAIDEKVYFYTSLYETQQRFNDYIERNIDRLTAIPGNGFFKEYQSGIADNINGWDFLNAEAYVGFNISKSIGIEFGHGSHFIGNGHRSLLLGNYAHNYFYLKFNTQFWKFRYQNIFAELSAFGQGETRGNQILPKKYMAAHYLDFNITDNLSIGLFEAVIFSRLNNFEFQYLNPVIIYRTVEGFLDSPDNVLIGLNAKYNLKNRVQFYSQLILDEFKFDQLSQGNGWWANKYGIQVGAKYINVANIDHLDAQVEYNMIRPYTYAHRDTIDAISNFSTASYAHYNQPLAHPLGANFKEVILKLRYQPMHKLIVEGRVIRTDYGADPDANSNFGGDILKSYRTRENDFDNVIGQGEGTRITLLGLNASYQFFHNMFAEFNMLYRKSDSDLDANDLDTQYIGAGLRINIARQKLDY